MGRRVAPLVRSYRKALYVHQVGHLSPISGLLDRLEERRAVGFHLVRTHPPDLLEGGGVGGGGVGDKLERSVVTDDIRRYFLLAGEAKAHGPQALEALTGVGVECNAVAAVGI